MDKRKWRSKGFISALMTLLICSISYAGEGEKDRHQPGAKAVKAPAAKAEQKIISRPKIHTEVNTAEDKGANVQQRAFGDDNGVGEERAFGDDNGVGEETAFGDDNGVGEETASGDDNGVGEERAFGDDNGVGEISNGSLGVDDKKNIGSVPAPGK